MSGGGICTCDDAQGPDGCFIHRRSKADLVGLRADLLDVLKVCGIEPSGIMSFEDDLIAIKRYVLGLQSTVSGLQEKLDECGRAGCPTARERSQHRP